MRGILAIAQRDLAAMFLTLAGWVILSAWGVIAALIFVLVTFQEGEPATLKAVISVAGWAMAVLAPAVSMRAFAEESRQGTLETLLSAPLSAGSLVIGKFIACVLMLLTMAAPVLLLALVTEGYGRIDPGELGSGLLGLLLLGMAMTSVGVLVSTRTSSQVVAYLVTFFCMVCPRRCHQGAAGDSSSDLAEQCFCEIAGMVHRIRSSGSSQRVFTGALRYWKRRVVLGCDRVLPSRGNGFPGVATASSTQFNWWSISGNVFNHELFNCCGGVRRECIDHLRITCASRRSGSHQDACILFGPSDERTS